MELLPELPESSGPTPLCPRLDERIPEQGGPDEEILREGLILSGLTGREDESVANRKPAKARYQDLPPQNDPDNPPGQGAKPGERGQSVSPMGNQVDRYQSGHEKHLVGQWIKQFSDFGNPTVLPGQVPIPEITESGDHEENVRGKSNPRALRQRQCGDYGTGRNTCDRDGIG